MCSCGHNEFVIVSARRNSFNFDLAFSGITRKTARSEFLAGTRVVSKFLTFALSVGSISVADMHGFRVRRKLFHKLAHNENESQHIPSAYADMVHAFEFTEEGFAPTEQ